MTNHISLGVSYFPTVGDSSMKRLGDSKVTEKFQATIPRPVRKLLRLTSGDRLVFLSEHGTILVKRGRVEIQS